MTCLEIVIAIVNIIAVIAAPVVAVKVGQYLQDRAQIRKDKMDIFKTLMANRTGWSTASVYAMNIIDVVFADDISVRNCWKTYYERLCIFWKESIPDDDDESVNITCRRSRNG